MSHVNKKPILLVGAGGHSRVCIDVIEQEGRFIVVGLIGLTHEVGTEILGYPVIGTDQDLAGLRKKYAHAFIALGQIKTPELRIKTFNILQDEGYELPEIVSPFAYVSKYAVLGAGTLVMHGAVVNANAVVGRNCIINSQSLVEHDVQIADHCHVATMAAINSGVVIGSGSFIGSGAGVRQGITIGEKCVIGMGQTVVKNCESGKHLPQSRGGK